MPRRGAIFVRVWMLGIVSEPRGTWPGRAYYARCQEALAALAAADPDNAQGGGETLGAWRTRAWAACPSARGTWPGRGPISRGPGGTPRRSRRPTPESAERGRDLAVSHERLGFVAEPQGGLAGRQGALSAPLELRQALAAADPESAKERLAWRSVHDKLGGVAEPRGTWPRRGGYFGARAWRWPRRWPRPTRPTPRSGVAWQSRTTSSAACPSGRGTWPRLRGTTRRRLDCARR